jgi:serine protease Do
MARQWARARRIHRRSLVSFVIQPGLFLCLAKRFPKAARRTSMRDRSPILMANIIFSAIIVGVVAGVGLRGEAQIPGLSPDPPAATAVSPSPDSAPRPDANVDAPAVLPPAAEATADATPPRHSPESAVDASERVESALQEAPPTPAAPSGPTAGRGRVGLFSFADIVERVSPAVVTVTSTREIDTGDGDGIFDRFFGGNGQHPNVSGHGSGFLIRADGIVLTNNHVVEEADDLVVRLRDGREFEAEIVGLDPKTDLAVLRIDADDLPILHLGDSDRMRVGDWVLAVGSPFRAALETSITAGIISGKGRGNVGIVEYEEFLQTDAAINPGNSGGPLINLEGEVIGINTAIATRNGGYQGVSFAIPATFAKPIVAALVQDGRVRRAWLGVQIQDVTAELARDLGLEHPEGVSIVVVHEDTPAEQAGLQKGDVVLSMDDIPTPNMSLFRNRVSLSHPGQRVAFEILRNGNVERVDVVLGELTDTVLAQVQSGRRAVPAPGPPNSDFGMELSELNSELREEYDLSHGLEGILVTSVTAGSTAAEAGLEPGDVIRAVNRHDVKTVREFADAVRTLPSDRPVVLNVKRGNQSFFVTLDPAS